MDGSQAQQIINEYGRVLEETASTINGVPEKLLPFKKDIIKQAIQWSIPQLSPTDDKMRNLLEVGYMSLANFVPNHEAQITAKFQEAIESRDANHPNWKYSESAMKINDKITFNTNILLKEIRSYISSSVSL